MNIFYLDHNPVKAARYMFDVHVNKMIVESCQMLANLYPKNELANAPRTQTGNVRSHSYPHHPCSAWVQESRQNFDWLVEHTGGLLLERQYRYGKGHFCREFWEWVRSDTLMLPDVGLTMPAQAFGPYGHLRQSNPVKAYRAYYATKVFNKSGKRQDVWTRRGCPWWWTENQIVFHEKKK